MNSQAYPNEDEAIFLGCFYGRPDSCDFNARFELSLHNLESSWAGPRALFGYVYARSYKKLSEWLFVAHFGSSLRLDHCVNFLSAERTQVIWQQHVCKLFKYLLKLYIFLRENIISKIHFYFFLCKLLWY